MCGVAFIIYDTPGSNSASNTDHTEVLKKAMEGQTNGLPIFVTTPDNMNGKDNTELIETIEKLGGALDKSNLMIVVNKADEKDCETLEKKKENFPNLKVSSLNPAGTYFVSAIIGLGSKKILFDTGRGIIYFAVCHQSLALWSIAGGSENPSLGDRSLTASCFLPENRLA